MNRKYFNIISWIFVSIALVLKFTTNLKWYLYIVPMLLIVLVLEIISSLKKRGEKNQKTDNLKYRNYYITSTLMFLNPFVFIQSLFQLTGELRLKIKNKKDIQKTKNQYSLPFGGKWCAINGGTSKKNSHSWDILTQRFAYDFVIVDNRKRSFKNDPGIIENYYCYDQPLFASQNGIVVRVKNNVRDYQKVGNFSVDWKTHHIAGNFIAIKHKNYEFSFYAHLKKNSIKVKKGESVRRGQYIANCGNSGNSTEPHLHFQVMTNKNFFFGKSLKIRFKNITNKTKEKVEFVEKNMIVGNLEKVANNFQS